jgi:hypothetical protein
MRGYLSKNRRIKRNTNAQNNTRMTSTIEQRTTDQLKSDYTQNESGLTRMRQEPTYQIEADKSSSGGDKSLLYKQPVIMPSVQIEESKRTTVHQIKKYAGSM